MILWPQAFWLHIPISKQQGKSYRLAVRWISKFKVEGKLRTAEVFGRFRCWTVGFYSLFPMVFLWFPMMCQGSMMLWKNCFSLFVFQCVWYRQTGYAESNVSEALRSRNGWRVLKAKRYESFQTKKSKLGLDSKFVTQAGRIKPYISSHVRCFWRAAQEEEELMWSQSNDWMFEGPRFVMTSMQIYIYIYIYICKTSDNYG